MLNALRRAAKTVFAKILIGLLVLSFGVWGISDFVNQINPTEVARAGDTPISAAEFDRVYRLQSFRTGQQLGQQLTPQQAQAIGLPQQVLQSLVTEALQVDAAHSLGLDIGDDALAARIRGEEGFAGSNGFSRDRFNQFLANANYNEDEYVALQREAAAQEMWVNSLVGGVTAPTAYIEALNRYANQTREVSHFTLTDDAIGVLEDPSDETLQAYYDAHKADFRSPERRTFSIVTLSPEALAEPDTVSADAVRRAYEIDGAYGSPEQREVQQVILGDRDVAQKAADAVNKGYAFAVVLRQLGKKFADVNLGTVQRTQIFDPAVAEAAFGLEAKKATVVDGRFGPTLVRVGTIEPSGKRPLEEVEGEIRQSLALEEAVDQVRTLETSVTDAIAGGAQVAEVAERFGLPTRTIELVTSQGIGPDGSTVDIPQSADVLRAAFAADAGADAVPVEDGRTTTWVQVDTVAEAAEQPFEDVTGNVIFAWTEAEKVSRLDALAEEALAALKSGTPIDEVAAKYEAQVEVSPAFSRGQPPEGLPQAAAAEAFAGPKGHSASVRTDDGNVMLIEVTNVSEPAFFEEAADLAPIRTALDDGLANAMLFDLVNAWQAEVGATVNQPVLNRVIGLDAQAGS